jgi:hypothetical protein
VWDRHPVFAPPSERRTEKKQATADGGPEAPPRIAADVLGLRGRSVLSLFRPSLMQTLEGRPLPRTIARLIFSMWSPAI